MADYPMASNDFFDGGGMWIFALLILLMIGNGGLFGGTSNALSQQDLQRAIDLNSIQNGQRDIEARVQEIGSEGIVATKDVAYNNLSEIRDIGTAIATGFANQQNCCCETNRNIDSVRYDVAMQTSSNTQKILDAINANRQADLQNRINQLEMQNIVTQNAMAINSATCGVVKYPMASTYNVGYSPFCNTGCGCSAF